MSKKNNTIGISGIIILILSLLVFGRTIINDIEINIKQINEDNNNIKNDNNILKQENKNLKKEISNIKEKISNKENILSQLTENYKSLESKINTIQQNIEIIIKKQNNQINNNPNEYPQDNQIRFIKNGFSDWTKEINQDIINNNIAITRQNQDGLYNHLYSPDNKTKDPKLFWFIGSGPKDIQGPIKNSFSEALYNQPDYALNGIPDNDPLNIAPEIAPHPASPNGLIKDNIPITLQIKNSGTNDDYYILKFIKWNGNFEIDENENRPGGGEFEYIRTKYQE